MSGFTAGNNNNQMSDLANILSLISSPEKFQEKIAHHNQMESRTSEIVEEANSAALRKSECEGWVVQQRELIAQEWQAVQAATEAVAQKTAGLNVRESALLAREGHFEEGSISYMTYIRELSAKYFAKVAALA